MTHTKQPTAIICLSPNSGGMEIDAIKLAQKLSSYSSVTLIAKTNSFIESQKNTYINQNNIQLETIAFQYNFSLNMIIKARKIIQEYGIKNIIFFGASELRSLYFSFLGLDINLIIRHGTTKSRPKKDIFHKLIYSQVNYHVSICKHLENNVKDIIPFGENTQSKLIYSSFNFQTLQHLQQDKLTLLHIGRIAKGKGQKDAILACEILETNNIDFQLNIVGGFEEEYKTEFMNFYNQCPYKEKIKLVGFTNNVQQYIRIADIFIFPSYGEGLSNAFMEALAGNLVCISYNNTSFPELNDLGLYFVLAENKDIQDLQTKLLSVVKNLEYEKKKVESNQSLIKKFFSLENEINNYLEILK